MKKLLDGMTHNGRVVTYSEPFWAIPFNLFTVYLVLYMMELGLTERQVGIVQTILISTQIIASLFSGRLTDKLGSKKTTIIFDMISWALACFIWSISKSFMWFAAAAFLNGINKIVNVSFTYLLTQGATQVQRLKNYTGMHIMVLAGGLFAPIAGIIISRLGFIPGVRIIFGFSALIMGVMFIIRNINFVEPESHPNRRKIGIIPGILESFQYFTSQKDLRKSFILQAIGQFYIAFKPIFYYAYLKKNIGLNSIQISLVPVFLSIITMIILLGFIPRIKSDIKVLTFGFFAGSLSLVLLVLSIKGSMFLLIISILLDAINTAIIGPVLSSYWISKIDGSRSTTQLGAGFFLFGVLSIPSGIAAAELYSISPILPFIAASSFMLISGFIGLSIIKDNKCKI